MRHFILHTRRAGHLVTRPLNCGVSRMLFHRIAIPFVGLLCLCGCTREGVSVPREGVYAGCYSRGFELSSFRPLGSSEEWWVVWADTVDLPEISKGYLSVRGAESDEGNFGHFGVYPREITAAEVMEARALSEAECDEL